MRVGWNEIGEFVLCDSGEVAITKTQYLMSNHWDDMRSLVLLAKGERCSRCGDRAGDQNIHHLRYENIGREELNDLVVLCAGCHLEVHSEVSEPLETPFTFSVIGEWRKVYGWMDKKLEARENEKKGAEWDGVAHQPMLVL